MPKQVSQAQEVRLIIAKAAFFEHHAMEEPAHPIKRRVSPAYRPSGLFALMAEANREGAGWRPCICAERCKAAIATPTGSCGFTGEEREWVAKKLGVEVDLCDAASIYPPYSDKIFEAFDEHKHRIQCVCRHHDDFYAPADLDELEFPEGLRRSTHVGNPWGFMTALTKTHAEDSDDESDEEPRELILIDFLYEDIKGYYEHTAEDREKYGPADTEEIRRQCIPWVIHAHHWRAAVGRDGIELREALLQVVAAHAMIVGRVDPLSIENIKGRELYAFPPPTVGGAYVSLARSCGDYGSGWKREWSTRWPTPNELCAFPRVHTGASLPVAPALIKMFAPLFLLTLICELLDEHTPEPAPTDLLTIEQRNRIQSRVARSEPPALLPPAIGCGTVARTPTVEESNARAEAANEAMDELDRGGGGEQPEAGRGRGRGRGRRGHNWGPAAGVSGRSEVNQDESEGEEGDGEDEVIEYTGKWDDLTASYEATKAAWPDQRTRLAKLEKKTEYTEHESYGRLKTLLTQGKETFEKLGLSTDPSHDHRLAECEVCGLPFQTVICQGTEGKHCGKAFHPWCANQRAGEKAIIGMRTTVGFVNTVASTVDPLAQCFQCSDCATDDGHTEALARVNARPEPERPYRAWSSQLPAGKQYGEPEGGKVRCIICQKQLGSSMVARYEPACGDGCPLTKLCDPEFAPEEDAAAVCVVCAVKNAHTLAPEKANHCPCCVTEGKTAIASLFGSRKFGLCAGPGLSLAEKRDKTTAALKSRLEEIDELLEKIPADVEAAKAAKAANEAAKEAEEQLLERQSLQIAGARKRARRAAPSGDESSSEEPPEQAQRTNPPEAGEPLVVVPGTVVDGDPDDENMWEASVSADTIDMAPLVATAEPPAGVGEGEPAGGSSSANPPLTSLQELFRLGGGDVPEPKLAATLYSETIVRQPQP